MLSDLDEGPLGLRMPLWPLVNQGASTRGVSLDRVIGAEDLSAGIASGGTGGFHWMYGPL